MPDLWNTIEENIKMTSNQTERPTFDAGDIIPPTTDKWRCEPLQSFAVQVAGICDIRSFNNMDRSLHLDSNNS